MKADELLFLQEMENLKHDLTVIRDFLPVIQEDYQKYRGTGKYMEERTTKRVRQTVQNLLSVLYNITLLLGEMELADLMDKVKTFSIALQKFDFWNSNYSPLIAAISAVIDLLPCETENINAKALGHLMNRVRMGYFPTDLKHVALIKEALVFPKGTQVNLFDPCCGCGLALEQLALGEQSLTYGIEIDETRGREAKGRLYRVGLGSFFQSRINIETFHCLFLNPPYLSVTTQDGKKRMEKAFLADSFHHLMYGGILVYIIPYYRLTEDICRFLAAHFDDIRIYRFMEDEFKKFKQILVIGKRCIFKGEPRGYEQLLSAALQPEQLLTVADMETQRYHLPDKEKKINIFKGAVFDIQELSDNLGKSKTHEILFYSRILDERERKPLLPLNTSQIGLIGGSGLMNGLIDCETPHVVKGRIIKTKTNNVMDENDKTMTFSQLTTNRMLFNVLTPDGFRSLT